MKCNFPMLCGRNKEVCCHYCNLECNYKCPIDKSECEDFEEKKIQDLYAEREAKESFEQYLEQYVGYLS